MCGVRGWVAIDNTNPERARLRARSEHDGVVVTKASKNSGLRQDMGYEFVEFDVWEPEHPDEAPPTV
eukprot:6714375-Lingulodinium_polyedra.AAC.1